LMSRRVGRVNGRHCSGPRKKSPAPWLAARRRDADCNRTWKALRPGLSRLRCSQHVRLWPVGRGHVGALPHCCGPQRPLPAGCSSEKAAMRRRERKPHRSLRAICVGGVISTSLSHVP
jgi:hypothetical protein